jgi:RNA polymerase sigma factor (TIGR02999 family)
MEDSITGCLRQIQLGQTHAEARLLDLVYNHLRKMAGQRLRRERIDHTLQPTALANEVCLKLIRGTKGIDWKDCDHFYATCGQMMRNILIDYARRRKFEKVDLEFAPGIAITERRSDELLALDAALDRLAQFDPRGAQVIELISFTGMTQKEVAEALHLSERTVKRDFAAGRTWLKKQLGNQLPATSESTAPAIATED